MKTQKILATIFEGMYGQKDNNKEKVKKQKELTKHLIESRIKT